MTVGLCILSGGQDSTTVLFHMKQTCEVMHAITFNYNQKHSIEVSAAIDVARLANVRDHYLCRIDKLWSASPLVDEKQSLETYESFARMVETIGGRTELTFVPMRNLIFLVFAANYAVHVGATEIGIGVSQEDTANYPDCRSSFIASAEDALNIALGEGHTRLQIHTPLAYRSKADSIRYAMTLPGCYKALAYTHTAYSGEYPPITQDHATVLRAEGFRVAAVPDPMIARAAFEGKINCPDGVHYAVVRRLHNLKGTIDYKLDLLAHEMGAV